MRIALRTGGGRGVYELAGSQGSYQAADLFDKELFYELTPSLIIPGRAVPSRRDGKPRINLNESTRGITTHLWLFLASLLLLPEPKREFNTTAGNALLAKEYSMTIIKIDVVRIELERAVVRPTEILLESRQGFRRSLNFVNRIARVMELWRVATNQDSKLAQLLRKHKETLDAEEINYKDVQTAAKNIFKYFNGVNYDPIREIESRMGIDEYYEFEEMYPVKPTESFGVDDEKSSELARIESVRRWRKVAVRGAAATKFRSDIKEIYRDTCLFTGQRLPKLESIASAGVDAAHILPWASHQINTLSNGICLSKQCHWAFDSGVIKFSFDRSINQYIISIPDTVLVEARQNNFSLDAYQAMAGPVPRERLPVNSNFWPDIQYLDKFNEIMFP